MRAQRRFGVNRSWVGLTAVFLVDVAVLALVSNLPKAWQGGQVVWWVGVGVAAVLTTAAVVTYRGITPVAALGRWLWDLSGDPEAALTATCTPAVDHRRRFGRDVVGLREHQGRLVAMVAVTGLPNEPSGRHHQPVVQSVPLPVEAVAEALCQFDLRLDSIDIVSVAAQVGADADARAHQRRTWLVLRMDPQRNAAGVATRDSLASAVAVCAERLAQDLDRRRCVARPVTGDEFAGVDSAVLAGMQPTWSRPGWRRLKHFNGYATSFWVSPRDITSRTLGELWLPDTDATVMTIRVAARGGQPEVSAWVRYHSAEPLAKHDWAGLNPLTGRQLAAVRASLPAPATRPPLVVPSRPLSEGEQLIVPLCPARESEDSPAGH